MVPARAFHIGLSPGRRCDRDVFDSRVQRFTPGFTRGREVLEFVAGVDDVAFFFDDEARCVDH